MIKISVSKTLTNEIKGIAMLVVVIVVMSIVLLKFKTSNIGGAVCTGSFPNYNATSDLCYNSTGSTQALGTIGTNINNSVTYLGEPITWISIIILVIVIAWVMKYFSGKKGGL